MKKLLKNKLFGVVLVLALTIPTLLPFFKTTFYTFHDEPQIANIFEYVRAIKLGQFPPRWAPDMHFTYGSPYLQFNYQLPYYLASLFYFLGFTLVSSFKLTLMFSVLAGSLGMYILGLRFSTQLIAIAAAVLYSYAPYHAVDLYVRGAIGEVMALGLFPWIIISLHQLLKSPNLKNTILAGSVVGLLLLTHQPSSILALPLFYAIFFLTALLQKNKKAIKGLLGSVLISLGLSAYYIFPLFAESGFIKEVAPFNFYDHFPFIKQLIYSPWGYGRSIWGPADEMSFQIGLVQLAVLVLVFVSILKIIKTKSKSKWLPIFILTGIFLTLFLMNIRSSFLWQIFPFSQSIQFPWRFLLITTFLIPVVLIYSSKEVIYLQRKFIPLTIIILSIALGVGYFHYREDFDHQDAHFLRRFLPNQVLYPGETVSTAYLDYAEESYPLPVNAVRLTDIPESKLSAKSGEALIKVENDNPFNFQAAIEAEDEDELTYHVFNYPGWQVYLNKIPSEIKPDKFGAISFSVPSGRHSLTIKFNETPVRAVSNIISIATIVATVAVLSKRKKNES